MPHLPWARDPGGRNTDGPAAQIAVDRIECQHGSPAPIFRRRPIALDLDQALAAFLPQSLTSLRY